MTMSITEQAEKIYKKHELRKKSTKPSNKFYHQPNQNNNYKNNKQWLQPLIPEMIFISTHPTNNRRKKKGSARRTTVFYISKSKSFLGFTSRAFESSNKVSKVIFFSPRSNFEILL